MFALLVMASLMTTTSAVAVETFTVMTAAAASTFGELHMAAIIGLLIGILVGKQAFPSGDVDVDAYKPNDEKIEALMRPMMINLLNCFGDRKPSKKGKSKKTDRTFADLYTEVARVVDDALGRQTGNAGSSDPTPMTTTEAKGLINFANEMKKIEPLVERTSMDDIMMTLNEFIADLKKVQKVCPIEDFLADNKSAKSPSYFGAWLPTGHFDDFGSDHVTTAYDPADKVKFFDYNGTYVTVIPAMETVAWTDEKSQDYAYRPCKIVFGNGTSMVSHNSIHLPDGGVQFGLNGKHQRATMKADGFQDYTWDDDKAFTTLHVPFLIKSSDDAVIQCDFDKTLMKHKTTTNSKDEFNPELLHDPSTVKLSNVSDFGHFVRDLGIPFRLVTSRSGSQKRKELETAIRSLFPNCVSISWGKKIRCPAGPTRDKVKADDKHSRYIPNMWVFDDEDIVIKTHGYGTLIRDEKDAIHYHGLALPPIHTAFAVNGPIGAGKTTLIESFIKSIGGVIPFVNDDGKSPLVMVAAADASDPDHSTLPYDVFANSYPDRETYFIFDTTGDGRKNIGLPVFRLSPILTPTVMAGCLISLLSRTNHANLNGIGEFDFESPPDRQPWNTNDMDLTTFINYLWFTRGQSQFAFDQAMARLGQTTTFSVHGDILYVRTSYREGLQFWNSVWGRQNRKCVHAFIDNHWHLIKSGLDVGAEMKPNTHSEDGDIYKKKLSPFQNWICRNLFTGKALPKSVMTSKKDGALIQTTMIVEHVDIMYESIMSSDNAFAKILAQASYDASNGKSFILISTNGTFMAASHMWDYIATAVACDFGLTKDEVKMMMEQTPSQEFQSIINDYTTSSMSTIKPLNRAQLETLLTRIGGTPNDTMSSKGLRRAIRKMTGNLSDLQIAKMYHSHNGVLSLWSQLVHRFNAREQNFWAPLNYTVNATHQLEAICPYRTTCAGMVHTELAMSYPAGGLISMGVKCGEEYSPHFTMEEHVHKVGYNQPLFWIENDSVAILKMLTALQRLSTDSEYTDVDFLAEFPPNNTYMPSMIHVDHEGFVLLVERLTKDLGTGAVRKGWDYGKLKTLLYYMFHKPRESTMPQLVELSLARNLPHFPVSKVIRDCHMAMMSVDLPRLDRDVDEAMTAYAPPQPIGKDANDRKIAGQFKAYNAKRTAVERESTSQNVSSWRRYMFNVNRTDSNNMETDVYTLVMLAFDADYVVSKYLGLINRNSKTLSDAEKTYQKIMINSMSTVSNVVQETFSEENVDLLRRHMMYLRLNLPE